MDDPAPTTERGVSPWRTFLRVFCGTWLLVMTEGIVLAGISYSYFHAQPAWIAVVAALVALAEAFGAAGVLALKRAVISAMIDALRSWQLGRKAVQKLFDRLVGSSGEGPPTGVIAGGLQRLPLAEVERRLTG